MDKRAALKQRILGLIAGQDPAVLMNDADKLQLKSLLDELVAHTLVPAPIDELETVEGVWTSLFTSFAVKHSDDKPMIHTSSLANQSFNNLPKVPVHVTSIDQEIHADTRAYNNVVFVQNEDRSANGIVVMQGEFTGDADNPQRFGVAFYRVSLRAAEGQSDAQLREQFGLQPDDALAKDFKPPRLHSDIVYLDDDLRINYGGLGGFYVLKRLTRAGFSINYPAAA